MSFRHLDRGPFVLFCAIVPIREGQSLPHALRRADSLSKTFLENNAPSGDPNLKGIWTAGEVETVRQPSVSRKPFPVIVFSGSDRNQLSIFEKPGEALGVLVKMVEHILPQIEEVDLRTPVALFYGGTHVAVTHEPAARTSASDEVVDELQFGLFNRVARAQR